MRDLSFFDKILFAANLIFAILLLFSCAVPHISVANFPFLSVLSLAVPILVIINLFFLIYWFFRRKKQFVWSLLILVLGYFFLGSFFRFKFSEAPVLEEDLSVMSYNVRLFNRYKEIDNPSLTSDVLDFVTEQNPDVICFQEFDYYTKAEEFKQYPYSYITNEYGTKKVILAIFSKYPFVSKGPLNFPDSPNNGIYADILYSGDTIRIYNLHLQSLRVIPKADAISSEPSGKLYKRLSRSFAKQQQQAEIFDRHRKGSPYKKIVCGDFNNTQFSNVYKIIKGNMQDTFDEMGTGYGRTFNFKYFPVRIDFIFVDDGFEVEAHKNFDVKLSDHFPVMASVRFQGQ